MGRARRLAAAELGATGATGDVGWLADTGNSRQQWRLISKSIQQPPPPPPYLELSNGISHRSSLGVPLGLNSTMDGVVHH